MRGRPETLGDRSRLIGVAALAVVSAGMAARAGTGHDGGTRRSGTPTTLACDSGTTTTTTSSSTTTSTTTTTTTTTTTVAPTSDVTDTTLPAPCDGDGTTTSAPTTTAGPSPTTTSGGSAPLATATTAPSATAAASSTGAPATTAPTATQPDVASATLPPKPPEDWPVRPITFPVAGPVTYYDDWGACRGGPLCPRRHIGNDLIGQRLQPLLAARDGVVTHLVLDNPTAGWGLVITDADGWEYRYYHVNDDTPGTDDGTSPVQWRLAPGVAEGAHVHAGQIVAYLGDSGNAELSVPHLHFEIHLPNGGPIDPYRSLRFSEWMGRCSAAAAPALQPESALMPPINATLADAVVHTTTGHGTFLLSLDGTVVALGDARFVGWSRHAPEDPACPPRAATPAAAVRPAVTTSASP